MHTGSPNRQNRCSRPLVCRGRNSRLAGYGALFSLARDATVVQRLAPIIPGSAPVSEPEPAKASRTVEPPLDPRELEKRLVGGPFAPDGLCPWCDRRKGWVREHKRQAKRNRKL